MRFPMETTLAEKDSRPRPAACIGCGSTALRDDFTNYTPMHIGQPAFDTVMIKGEFGVVDA
jgi:hypothetical protein